MTKKCPACHQSFDCKQDDIFNCQCSTIQLDAKSLHTLHAKYRDCLCLDCLKKMKAGILTEKTSKEKK